MTNGATHFVVITAATAGKEESRLGYVESPNLDRLAAEGVLFTNAYCNSMACAPSRSSMHTGKYPHRCGMYGFRKAHQAAGCASRIIPDVMKERGYQTAMFGKSGYYIFDWEHYNQWKDTGAYQPFLHRNKLEETATSDFWFNRPWGQHNGRGMVLGSEEVFRYADGSVKRFWLNRVDREITDAERATRAAVEAELDILRSHTRRNPNLILGGVSANTTDRTLDGTIVRCLQEHLNNAAKEYRTAIGEMATGPDPDQPVFLHLGMCLPHTPVMPSKEFRDRFSNKRYEILVTTKPKEKRCHPRCGGCVI